MQHGRYRGRALVQRLMGTTARLIAAGCCALLCGAAVDGVEGGKPLSVGIGLHFEFGRPASAPAPEPKPAPEPAPEPELGHEPGELLILWRSAKEAEAGQRWMLRRHGLTPVRVDRLDALGLVMGQFKLRGGQDPIALRQQIRRDRPRWVVDVNTLSALLADAGAPGARAAPPKLYARDLLGLPNEGDGAPPGATAMKLGVVDTGFELDSALVVGRFVVRDFLQPGETPASTDHGSALAQLVAGRRLANGFGGVAPGVQLFWARTVRVVDGQPRSNTASMARAVGWLAEEGVHAINISQGGPGDAVLQEVFTRLVQRPLTAVAAAGNGGPRAAPVFPAAYPGVLAVTAVDAASQPYALANRGAYVALAAPGVDVWVPVSSTPGPTATGDPSAASSGRYRSGTSVASVLVAATLAHAGAGFWRAAADQRATRLCQAARDLGAPGRDPVFGCGLLQLPLAPAATASSLPR
jgi:hypothetical protein